MDEAQILPAPVPHGFSTATAAAMLEAWVCRRSSPHTRRAYRGDVEAFARFLGLGWPDGAAAVLSASVRAVLAFRDHLAAAGAAPQFLPLRRRGRR